MGQNCTKAFEQLKKALIIVSIIGPSVSKRPLKLHIEASSFALGAILTQRYDEEQTRVVMYTLRKLLSAKQNNTANERKLLSQVQGLHTTLLLLLERCYIVTMSLQEIV